MEHEQPLSERSLGGTWRQIVFVRLKIATQLTLCSHLRESYYTRDLTKAPARTRGERDGTIQALAFPIPATLALTDSVRRSGVQSEARRRRRRKAFEEGK